MSSLAIETHSDDANSPWTCSACQQRVPQQFHTCMECGASRAGVSGVRPSHVPEGRFVNTLAIAEHEVEPVKLATFAARDLPPPLPRRRARRAARPDLTLTVLDDELHPVAFALPFTGFRPLSTTPPPLKCGDRQAASLLGQIVDNEYRVLSCLGRGGMGIVYKVERLADGKILAMKVLSSELASQPLFVERFRNEARALLSLSHPNTVHVCEYGETSDQLYLVMEYLQGCDLGSIIRSQGPLRPARLIRIAVQACASIQEAHERGIIHRDIKPENLFVLDARDGHEQVKVLDFGIAKLRTTDETSTPERMQVVGTPHYMAPEQIRGESVDARADVYAFGGLLYTALTGTSPFAAATPSEVLAKHLSCEPPPMRERLPGLTVSAELEQVVLRALAKDPAQRQPSMTALAEELTACLALEDSRARRSTRVKKVVKARKRRRAA